MTRSSDHDKLGGLEILRFACAIGILLWHYQMLSYVGLKSENFRQDAQPFFTLLQPMYQSGYLAVPYFWCISGFIFFWKYQHALRESVSGKEFFMMRFSRLYPLHFATLIFVAAIQPIHSLIVGNYFAYSDNTISSFIFHLFLAGNWQFPTYTSFNGPIWSVSVEVAAYATFFFVCRYTSVSGAIALGIVILGSLLYPHFEPELQILSCLTFFYFGGMVCYARRFLDAKGRASPASFLLLALYGPLWWFEPQLPFGHRVQMLIKIPLIVLAFACLPLPKSRLTSIFVGAGALTYSLYLLHFPLMLTIQTAYAAAGKPIPYTTSAMFIAFFSVLLLLAHLCHRYFEMPVQNRIRRSLLRRPRQVAAVSP